MSGVFVMIKGLYGFSIWADLKPHESPCRVLDAVSRKLCHLILYQHLKVQQHELIIEPDLEMEKGSFVLFLPFTQ